VVEAVVELVAVELVVDGEVVDLTVDAEVVDLVVGAEVDAEVDAEDPDPPEPPQPAIAAPAPRAAPVSAAVASTRWIGRIRLNCAILSISERYDAPAA
jgi:hypothetical protein